ncbi:hypothetical protein ABIB56_003353 [Glaciihabitans sp. UYNi722]
MGERSDTELPNAYQIWLNDLTRSKQQNPLKTPLDSHRSIHSTGRDPQVSGKIRTGQFLTLQEAMP